MSSDIGSRADELTFGFGSEAISESILRAQDDIELKLPGEAQRWISTAFELRRREKTPRPS